MKSKEKSKGQLKKEAKKQQKAEHGKGEEGKQCQCEKKQCPEEKKQCPEEKKQEAPKQKQQQQKPQLTAVAQTIRPKIKGEVNFKNVQPSDFYIFNIRVAKITECWKHESSDKLYCEKMSTGDHIYNVASGLQQNIPIETMSGLVILLTNLKGRKLGGFNSEAMVLCASIKGDKEQHELLRVEKSEEKDLGKRVLLEGVKEEQPFAEVTDKDGVVGKLLGGMKLDSEGYATFLGKRWVVDGKFIKGQMLKNCSIS